jgi:hypothetical protein
MARPASAIHPRIMRAGNWFEHPSQNPAKPNELTVKNRRRENSLFKMVPAIGDY